MSHDVTQVISGCLEAWNVRDVEAVASAMLSPDASWSPSDMSCLLSGIAIALHDVNIHDFNIS